MNFSIFLIIWLGFIKSTFGQGIFAYSIEVALDIDGKLDNWPIVLEYDDPGTFKAGDLTSLSNIRSYITPVLTPYGQLRLKSGNVTGFNSEGFLGLKPVDEGFGFSLDDDELLYNDSSLWVACPIERNGKTIYGIKFDSNCTDGFPTNLTVISEEYISTEFNPKSLQTMIPESPASTSLSENSFKSYDYSTFDSSASPKLSWFTFFLAIAFSSILA
ncbi:hypothetical protein CLIB1444_01S10374 [[Candida] jaroonii]|uniref:Uncharacterized protein n=1 Tax=[Candida] jaroonii TaxID=467808 RepID=A0ACA9Y2N0_9ASCO|nr:hypothetical protein CLIB1444_01S10374 [[Candida] jaroonii]